MISTPEFWARVAEAASGNDKFARRSDHLRAVVIVFAIGDRSFYLDFHRGKVAVLASRPMEGAAITISGPKEEWHRLVAGKISYAQAINVSHGKLRLEGNLLAAAWVVQTLAELFRVAARIHGKEAKHA